MNTKENKNFLSVSKYTDLRKAQDEINTAKSTIHFSCDNRKSRKATAKHIDTKPIVDNAFLVDKGHKDGMEVHVVTKTGLIFIFNNMKMALGLPSLITVLIARPNQVKRLYDACNISVSPSILESCYEHVAKGYNK